MTKTRLRAIPGGVTAPMGFSAGAARGSIKPGSRRDDLALVWSDRPAVVAGVFTTNKVQAAPVVWSRRIVAGGGKVRGILLNSGNANACTGPEGDRATRDSAAALARVLDARAKDLLVASTGVIGVAFPSGRLIAGLPALVADLGRDARAALRAARAIMTTDTVPKQHAVTVRHGGRTWRVGGMAKGAGMIHPDMATMLAVIATDAPLTRTMARRLLRSAADDSFNALTIDGDTSTNDCVLLLANGAAGGAVSGAGAMAAIGAAIAAVSRALAEAIARDAEGSGKLLVVRVTGARSDAQARAIARTIASSMLVKTAVHGGDPNWGRVLAAAGRSGARIDPGDLDLRIGGHLVARGGCAYPNGERSAARHLRGRRIVMDLRVGDGKGASTALGSDLSADYVRINAHYRT